MRKITLLLLVSIIVFHSANSQHAAKPDENSIVKDSLGNTIPYTLWSQLMSTGRYKLKTEKKENTGFILVRISDEEFEKKLVNAPKPPPSESFRTGNKFGHFKTTDIRGNKINTKNLTGKIVVINFWFIKCPPCVREMPDLNDLVDTYKNDSSVVFIAVALDEKYDLEPFLKSTRFAYTIIEDGRFIADQYGIRAYPTNVVVDQQGKVYFHSRGFAVNTSFWIKKSIEELKAKQDNKIASVQMKNDD